MPRQSRVNASEIGKHTFSEAHQAQASLRAHVPHSVKSPQLGTAAAITRNRYTNSKSYQDNYLQQKSMQGMEIRQMVLLQCLPSIVAWKGNNHILSPGDNWGIERPQSY